MFERIRKAFARSPESADAPASQLDHGPVSEWAGTQGFAFSAHGQGKGIALDGKVRGKPWRLQVGRPARDYIRGEEIRARAELGIPDDVAVMVMNRPLKQALERRAYEMCTDTLQTTVDSNLTEEMRWLAMYDEVGWESLPDAYWSRWSIVAGTREHARAWIAPPLADLMMKWPQSGLTAEVPFLLMLMNGKVYLRMEYSSADLGTLQHASLVFTSACESALDAFRGG